MSIEDAAAIELRRFGVEVTPLSSGAVADLILASVRKKRTLWIGNHNLHSLYLWVSDQQFRRQYSKANLWIIDGWPILLFARFATRRNNSPALSTAQRVGSTDWLREIILRREPLNIVAIGASPESSRIAAQRMNSSFPWIAWNAYDGFGVTKQDEQAPSGTLESELATADLVLVGMGMPHQESWIAAHQEQLSGTVVANVGGCFDYISGVQPLAPRWLGVLGLEWMYRLWQSPRRLAYRYLLEPFLLAAYACRRTRRSD